ncbi:MAG: ABC transporter permease [Bacillota bacterium]|nr:ABC transporter permease [Bacillota bacterium]
MSTLKQIITEHIQWRYQVFKLAKADIIKTYSGAALGWAWALVRPTIMIFVFWFAFTYGLRVGGDENGYPFVLWLVPGYIAWQCMSDMITQGANSIRKYKYLVTKMKFPVSTIPTFTAFAKLAIHISLMILVVLLFIITGHFPDIYWLEIFFYMFCMLVFFTAWGLFASMLAAMSKDFLNLVKSVTQALFWVSGIMWDVSRIGIPALQKVLYFNPITYVANGYRNAFIFKVWFWEEPTQLLIFVGMTIVMFMLAVWAYRKLIKEIPDVL